MAVICAYLFNNNTYLVTKNPSIDIPSCCYLCRRWPKFGHNSWIGFELMHIAVNVLMSQTIANYADDPNYAVLGTMHFSASTILHRLPYHLDYLKSPHSSNKRFCYFEMFHAIVSCTITSTNDISQIGLNALMR